MLNLVQRTFNLAQSFASSSPGNMSDPDLFVLVTDIWIIVLIASTALLIFWLSELVQLDLGPPNDCINWYNNR